MNNLSNELIDLIFQYLEFKDIILLSQTCKYFMYFYKNNEDYIFEKLMLKKGINKYILDDIVKIYSKHENKYNICLSSTKNGRCKYKKYSIYCNKANPIHHVYCYNHKENIITMKIYYIIASRCLSLKYISLNLFSNGTCKNINYMNYVMILLFDEIKNVGEGFHKYKINLFTTFFNFLKLNIKYLDTNKIEIFILIYEKINSYINTYQLYFDDILIKKWNLTKNIQQLLKKKVKEKTIIL
jgi:hypothetical protein